MTAARQTVIADEALWRTTIGVAGLPLGADVETELVARLRAGAAS